MSDRRSEMTSSNVKNSELTSSTESNGLTSSSAESNGLTSSAESNGLASSSAESNGLTSSSAKSNGLTSSSTKKTEPTSSSAQNCELTSLTEKRSEQTSPHTERNELTPSHNRSELTSSSTERSELASSHTDNSELTSSSAEGTELTSSSTKTKELTSSPTQRCELTTSTEQKSKLTSSHTKMSMSTSSRTKRGEQTSSRTQRNELTSSGNNTSDLASSSAERSELASSPADNSHISQLTTPSARRKERTPFSARRSQPRGTATYPGCACRQHETDKKQFYRVYSHLFDCDAFPGAFRTKRCVSRCSLCRGRYEPVTHGSPNCGCELCPGCVQSFCLPRNLYVCPLCQTFEHEDLGRLAPEGFVRRMPLGPYLHEQTLREVQSFNGSLPCQTCNKRIQEGGPGPALGPAPTTDSAPAPGSGSAPHATSFCFTCRRPLCQACTRDCRGLPHGHLHIHVPIVPDLWLRHLRGQDEGRLCARHPDRSCGLFCTCCKVSTCECKASEHAEHAHRLWNVAETMENARNQLMTAYEALLERVVDLNVEIEVMQTMLDHPPRHGPLPFTVRHVKRLVAAACVLTLRAAVLEKALNPPEDNEDWTLFQFQTYVAAMMPLSDDFLSRFDYLLPHKAVTEGDLIMRKSRPR